MARTIGSTWLSPFIFVPLLISSHSEAGCSLLPISWPGELINFSCLLTPGKAFTFFYSPQEANLVQIITFLFLSVTHEPTGKRTTERKHCCMHKNGTPYDLFTSNMGGGDVTWPCSIPCVLLTVAFSWPVDFSCASWPTQRAISFSHGP